MTALSVTSNLEIDPWNDLRPEHLVLNPEGETAKVLRLGVLPNATAEHRAAVEILLQLPDGSLLVAETTLRLFNAAAAAVKASPVAQLEEY